MILNARTGSEHAGLRLDDAAKALFPQLSKGQIRRIIDLGGCAVNQVMVRVASRQMRAGEELSLGVMEAERFVEVSYDRVDMLFENNDYLAVNKAAGINSQRTPYQFKGTVEYAVGEYLKNIGSREPARVIHRLDRGTSGVMFFPKNKQSATHVADLLKNGEVTKVYWAVVDGIVDEDNWVVDAPIAKLNKFRYGVALPGKESCTRFRFLARGAGATLLEARPLTGRTHQIRVHLNHCHLPIIGDAPYGGSGASRMLLHCRTMSFAGRRGEEITAIAPPDDQFRSICESFRLPITPL